MPLKVWSGRPAPISAEPWTGPSAVFTIGVLAVSFDIRVLDGAERSAAPQGGSGRRRGEALAQFVRHFEQAAAIAFHDGLRLQLRRALRIQRHQGAAIRMHE